jgi:hypothetical protein
VGVFGRGSPGIRARGLSEEHQTNFSPNLTSEKYETAHHASIKLLSNGLSRANQGFSNSLTFFKTSGVVKNIYWD